MIKSQPIATAAWITSGDDELERFITGTGECNCAEVANLIANRQRVFILRSPLVYSSNCKLEDTFIISCLDSHLYVVSAGHNNGHAIGDKVARHSSVEECVSASAGLGIT